MKKLLRSGWAVGGVAVAALALNTFSGLPLADATHEPANKVSAAGSETEIVPASATEGTVILREMVKTSKPTDLILGVTLECSITTDVATLGSDTQSAEGTLKVWVEIDGVPVPVSEENTDVGRVVFCNRFYERTTQLGSDDEQDSVRTFMRTRAANGFNWLALNTGSAVHEIVVKAQLITSATQRSSALGVIGNRTLIVEPTKAANDEAVTALG